MIELAPTNAPQKIELQSTDTNASKISIHGNASSIPIDLFAAIKGDKGDDGDPGSNAGASTFVHTQASPSASWLILHSLGKFPSVTVIDSAGDTILVDLTYVDSNNVRLNFGSALAGTAYLN